MHSVRPAVRTFASLLRLGCKQPRRTSSGVSGRDESRPGVQESRSKLGRIGDRSRLFFSGKKPRENFLDQESDRGFLGNTDSIQDAARKGNLPCRAAGPRMSEGGWWRGRAVSAAHKRQVFSRALPESLARCGAQGTGRPPGSSPGDARRASRGYRLAAGCDPACSPTKIRKASAEAASQLRQDSANATGSPIGDSLKTRGGNENPSDAGLSPKTGNRVRSSCALWKLSLNAPGLRLALRLRDSVSGTTSR